MLRRHRAMWGQCRAGASWRNCTGTAPYGATRWHPALAAERSSPHKGQQQCPRTRLRWCCRRCLRSSDQWANEVTSSFNRNVPQPTHVTADRLRRGSSILLLIVASCAHRAKPGASSGPRAEPPVAKIARSDANARVLLAVLARFAPEGLGEVGIPGLDTEIHDLKARVNERFREEVAVAIAELQGRAASETDAYVAQDLVILITAARNYRQQTELEDEYLLPYEDVGKLVFRGLRALLDDQVPPQRRAAALVRLRRYAGLEPGYEPITKLATDRTRETFSRSGLLGPARAKVERALATASVYREGLRKLFDKYALPGHEPALAELERQLAEYDLFVRNEILPRARTDFREPPELYAFQLHQLGVESPPAELAEEARRAFADTQRKMQALAPRLGEKLGLGAVDYREVLRALKRDQLVDPALSELYKQRIHDLEDIIRRERLVSLPARPMRFRLASEAETAVEPAPHVDIQGLFAKNVELTFVLPLTAAPVQGRPAAKYDDFTFAAASWTISAHEGRPGHELQFSSMAARGLSLARTLFAFNAVNVEGWGLYSEWMTRPFMPLEGQFISLQALLGRQARAFLDPELQQGKLTLAEARRVLEQDVGLSPAMATQELDRYTFESPGQAVSYFYGYVRLRRLRVHAEKILGSAFAAQPFHDFVLAQGLLPPPLLLQAVDAGFLPR